MCFEFMEVTTSYATLTEILDHQTTRYYFFKNSWRTLRRFQRTLKGQMCLYLKMGGAVTLELWVSAIFLTWKNGNKSSKNQFASSEENTSDCVITQGLW